MIGYHMKKMMWSKMLYEANISRCHWVTDDPIYITYHDEEWGNLKHFTDDHYLFEMLTLEGAQAGLSWITILKRREHYRQAFHQFDPTKVALFDEVKINQLMQNKGIIRNRRKIVSTVDNAKAFLKIQEEHGSFHEFLWNYFGQKQRVNSPQTEDDVSTSTEDSTRLSKALKKRGFSFVGPVICYSFMQAVGLVDDHTKNCFLYDERRNI